MKPEESIRGVGEGGEPDYRALYEAAVARETRLSERMESVLWRLRNAWRGLVDVTQFGLADELAAIIIEAEVALTAERAEASLQPKADAELVKRLRGRIANYGKMLGNMGFYGPGDVALDEEAIQALSRPAPQKRPRKPYDGKWIKALTGLQIGESITVPVLDKVANIVTAKRAARERLNAPGAQWTTKATNRGRRITRIS